MTKMMHTIKAAAVLLFAGLSASAAQASTMSYDIGPEMGDADTCFVRNYSAQHLNANRAQQVTRIALAAIDRGANRPNMAANQSEFLIAIQTRAGGGWHSRLAYCSFAAGDSMNCGIESDGGRFTILNRSDGNVMIRAQGELRIGDESGPEIGGRVSDDNVFILTPAACDRGRSR